MSHKKSFRTVEKNKNIWAKNLVKFQQSHKRRGNVPTEELSLEEKCRMPLQRQIVGRYQFLGAEIKGRKERIVNITKELKNLWEKKLNFPHVSDQVIQRKLTCVLKTYDECVKRAKYDALDKLFDITKVKGEWLSTEDKRLYHLQVESRGEVGYATSKTAGKETIHPSKRRKLSAKSSTVKSASCDLLSSDSDKESDKSELEDSEYENGDEDEESTCSSKRKQSKSKVAVNLVSSTKVSTSKAAKICKQLALEGVNIPTPSQAGIYKSVFKEAFKLKEEMLKSLSTEQWSLHFDGKRLDENEYQVVVLKNERTEVKLAALRLQDGKARTITNGISTVLEEYNLWSAVKMIIADTTSVNTGNKNGVVVKLQQMFSEKGFDRPLFISCQHHVLDRILRVVMDEEIGGSTTSPNIEYPFVSQLMNSYEELKAKFVNGTEAIVDKSGWRDDMKFLYHLTCVFKFFEENGHFPLVNFQKIPNITNARWNSRAILAILAFVLIPETRPILKNICTFISYDWAKHWFADQFYNKEDFNSLSIALKPYKKGLQVLKNHWKQEPSPLQIPRSNQCAERAIKVMQELYAVCRKNDKLQFRFILSNKQ